MKPACQISAEALRLGGEAVKPGVTTAQIDKIIYDYIVSQGARPNFKGLGGFPGSACISVNDVVIHGIPSHGIVLHEGDIVSIDTGAAVHGWNGDNAATFACGEVSETAQRLMDVTKEALMRGIAAVKQHLGIKKVVIGIERNKPEAIDLMFSLVKNDPDYSVMPLQSRYPQGAEKVLIEKTTGREVPRGGLPADAGVIVLNVTTVSTLGKYLATGMPLTTKRLTVDGDAIGEAKNVEVVIGTPIGDVLDFCGVKDDVSKVLMGGPMMGTAVADPAFPVLKQNNALVAFGPAAAALPAPGPCIRCGNCINACPMGLSPVEIAGAYTKNDGEMLDKLMVDLCIGCGTCSYVCPAKRPVTQTMNLAKAVWQKNKNGGKK